MAVRVVEPSVAVTVTTAVVLTGVVFTVKVVELCPSGITTVGGTVRAALLLARFTVTPPAEAGALIVTELLVVVLPPTTWLDIRSDTNVAGATFTVAVRVTPS